ncbi:MAG: FHA domain-containing protein, partial [Spirochaetota bacterium]
SLIVKRKKDLLSADTRVFEASEDFVIHKTAQIFVGSEPRLEAHGKSKRLVRKSIGIGRDRSNSVIIADEKVSKFHAILTLKSGSAFIKDTGSTNGTMLNGEALVPNRNYKVAYGDVVVVGSTRLTIKG